LNIQLRAVCPFLCDLILPLKIFALKENALFIVQVTRFYFFHYVLTHHISFYSCQYALRFAYYALADGVPEYFSEQSKLLSTLKYKTL
jgi:hypothetical protein